MRRTRLQHARSIILVEAQLILQREGEDDGHDGMLQVPHPASGRTPTYEGKVADALTLEDPHQPAARTSQRPAPASGSVAAPRGHTSISDSVELPVQQAQDTLQASADQVRAVT